MRQLFGGGMADNVYVSSAGVLNEPGVAVVLTFWDDPLTMTFPLTDLTDILGNPITTVSTNTFGQIPQFYGPADGHKLMWADANGGAGPRQLMNGYNPSRFGPVGATGQQSLSAGFAETAIATGKIPKNILAGSTFRITAWGTLPTGGTGGSGNVKVRIGSITGTILTSMAFGQVASSTYVFRIVSEVQIQGVGASAAWSADVFGTAIASATLNAAGTSTGTLDNTVDQPLLLTLQSASATASAFVNGSTIEQVALCR